MALFNDGLYLCSVWVELFIFGDVIPLRMISTPRGALLLDSGAGFFMYTYIFENTLISY